MPMMCLPLGQELQGIYLSSFLFFWLPIILLSAKRTWLKTILFYVVSSDGEQRDDETDSWQLKDPHECQYVQKNI